jgi:membrane-bound lytic murein transglycosylase F
MKYKFNKLKIFLISSILFYNLFFVIDAMPFEEIIQIDDYDQYFQQYTEKYFKSDFDWRFFKAQAIAESKLSPKARSNHGAIGLMQILPSTFDELKRKNPSIQGSITDPRANIAAGIYYNSLLWAEWARKRSFNDRLNFMFASYNAGKHTILTAQQIAIDRGLNPYAWNSIAKILPEVNGPKSRETVSYIQKIHNITEKIRRQKATASSRNAEPLT